MSSRFETLVAKLKEIFQIDKPELDFGIYRILSARREQINDFLDNRLAKKVQSTLAGNAAAEEAALRANLAEAIDTAKNLGIENPDNLPKVRELQEKLAACSASLQAENEVYSHLLTFFSRYYDKGDFISQRRYKGDTYAIPYSGEEVKLHWANADQYYIKSGEGFSHYDFALPNGAKVHFRLVSAVLSKDNIKDNECVRCFTLWVPDNAEGAEPNTYPQEAIEEKADGLYIYFQYKRFKKGTQQAKVSDETVEKVRELLQTRWDILDRYNILAEAPTEKNKERTIFRKYLDAYTAKNTSDYFIHKDLKGFLSRELDFYIKNEMMHLDDIQHATAFSQIERNLRTIQAVRAIAGELIDFMAQIENFQKKLWLKKKFVVQCDYCLTMDLVPQKLHAEVLNNPKQQEEWRKLHTTEASLVADARMVDTQFFDEKFKGELLNSIKNLDEQCDGLLIRSENYGALQLLKPRYENSITGAFIDPPYNTDQNDFLYKDNYMDSSWLCMISDRIIKGVALLNSDAVLLASIGDEEQEYLSTFVREKFSKENFFATLIWEKKKKGSFLSGHVAKMKDYIICLAKDISKFSGLIGQINQDPETYPCVNPDNKIETRIFPAGLTSKYKQANHREPAGTIISAGNMSLKLLNDLVIEDGVLQYPVKIEGQWRYSQSSIDSFAKEGALYITQDLYIRRIVTNERTKVLKDLLFREGAKTSTKDSISSYAKIDLNDLNKFGWGCNEDANEELHHILGTQYAASYPKPSKLIQLLFASLRKTKGVFIDYFAGSGTTAHSIISLNREDKGNRKYILVEMGDHFDSVMKPRIQKVVYSPEWKDGKPITLDKGISHCFKYMSLESYEDTLNNIELHDTSIAALDSLMQEEYLLKYMLDIESRGSIINTDSFRKPFDYKLKIAVDSSGASEMRKVDLVETFNYLLGLHVESQNRNISKGYVTVEGRLTNGKRVLIFWRDCDKINSAELNKELKNKSINPKGREYDYIYVNGDHGIANLMISGEQDAPELKVRSIEEEFLTRMFEEE